MAMKRSREDQVAMDNYLMLLSQLGKCETLPTGRVYECKTCNRQFPSFQALGGHRASHKKLPKLMAGDHLLQQVPVKPKAHECSICGVEFALGQALGGHMRRHRAEMESNSTSTSTTTTTTTISDDPEVVKDVVPILMRSNSCKRVWGLDLNLMTYDHDYLKLGW